MANSHKIDSIIVNGKIVNVITKEIYESQIAIKEDYIYSIDEDLMYLKSYVGLNLRKSLNCR